MANEDEHPLAGMFRRSQNETVYVGRRADEVAAEAEANDVCVRRWDEDREGAGQPGAWTLDFRRSGRLNLWVRGGVVVWAAWF